MASRPAERTLRTEIAGRPVTFNYSETWVGYSIFALRIVLAYVFLSAGLEKLATDGWTNIGGFSAEAFLVGGVDEANPLKDVFLWFADFLWVIDPIVMFGQILIGLALLFGLFVRLACLAGALQMLLFWMAAWNGGILAGLPVDHGYIVDYTFVYAFVLFGLGAWGAGRILGIDAWLEETPVVRENPWLRWVLG